MRRLLFLASAACLVVAIVLATSSAARRTLSPRGADPGAHASSSLASASTEPSAPAVVQTLDRATVEPKKTYTSARGLIAQQPEPGSMAMILTVDPETGRLGLPQTGSRALTTDELQALARAESEGLVTIRNADGSETLNHEGRFADHTIVRVGPDGKPVFECVHGDAAVERALHGEPAPPTAEGE